MPTYEYHCDACEHHFEEFQSMHEDALTKCPECGKKKLRRVFGTGAAVLALLTRRRQGAAPRATYASYEDYLREHGN